MSELYSEYVSGHQKILFRRHASSTRSIWLAAKTGVTSTAENNAARAFARAYEVIKCIDDPSNVPCVPVDAATTRSMSQGKSQVIDVNVMSDRSNQNNDQGDGNDSSTTSTDDFDLKSPDLNTRHALRAEQLADTSLKRAWSLAEKNKGNFFLKNDLLYHADHVMGQRCSSYVFPKLKEKRCAAQLMM